MANLATTQQTEANKILQAEENIIPKRSRLVAYWIVVADKLVCQWRIEYE